MLFKSIRTRATKGALKSGIKIAILITLPGEKGLETRPSPLAQNERLKPKLSLLLTFCEETRTVIPFFICVFLLAMATQKVYIKEINLDSRSYKTNEARLLLQSRIFIYFYQYFERHGLPSSGSYI